MAALAIWLSFAVAPPFAGAVVPAGGELAVNSFTAGAQRDPDVAVAAATGDFAVVWESQSQRAGHADTYLQRFHEDGTRLGDETLVSDSVSTDFLHLSRVAAMPAGELAVVWQAEESDPGSAGVYARFYDANGAAFTQPLPIAPGAVSPAVAADPQARFFVVVWSEGATGAVVARQFARNGAPLGAAFTVAAAGRSPDVAVDGAGRSVIVWHRFVDPSYVVFGRRFDAAGAPLGAEFPVNVTSALAHTDPRVGAAPDGRFVVAWNRQEASFGNPNAVARRFDANAVALGPEFAVGTSATRDQWNPDVAFDASGAFTVVWQAFSATADELTDIYGQRFTADGRRDGEIFRASAFPRVQQDEPAIAAHPGGELVAVWQSVDQDGSGFGIFGRRFRAVAATIDFGGNGDTDVSVFRPSDGRWLADFDFQPGPELNVVYGRGGDIPVPKDYDGDGKTDFAVFRPASGTWFIDTNRNGGTDLKLVYGRDGDVPVPGDYDGDGVADLAVYRPTSATWFIDVDQNGGTDLRSVLGPIGAIPVPGDYDGDGKTDLAVFDRGTWIVRKGSTVVSVPYGRDGDIPVPGDYDGDGVTDLAVFRPASATWFVDLDQNGGTDLRIVYGRGDDVPVPGDYDGDGATDFAVFRPASGRWFVDTNRNGGTDLSVVFGASGDLPLHEGGWIRQALGLR